MRLGPSFWIRRLSLPVVLAHALAGGPCVDASTRIPPESLPPETGPDHPGCADDATIDAFASAILSLDDSVPTGTYVDMCSKLPLVDPAKIKAPTIVMRGEFDGIAGIEDLVEFFRLLPHPDKQFTVLEGISHATFQQKNYLSVYHVLHSFYSKPEPVFRA